jgi:predicted  nucleic acid-binding Zn-ribbon protein
MGPETLLQPACELSYAVARDGAEGEPIVDPPRSMRSFLYVSQLPERALDVARDVIEQDPAFRRRVAERATEDEIGRAGYLWLHRPKGWTAEFEEIVNINGVTDSGGGRGDGVDVVPAVSATSGPDDRNDGSSSGAGLGSYDGLANGGPPLGLSLGSANTGRSEANAIEDELSSLRGLVERLSSERQAVSSSARRVEQEIETARQQPSVFDTDIYTLQAELESARTELDQARVERDNAVRQQSEALTRRLELEKELARSRDLRAEIEHEHAATDARLVEVQETLARAEAALVVLEEKKEELESQVTVARIDHDELRTQMNRAAEEHSNRYHTLETAHHALEAEITALRGEKEQLSATLAESRDELTRVRAELAQTEGQATETQSLVDALTEEKIDLASRLADTEAMLETTRTQINAVKADAQAVTADLANVRAHRDGLSAQVDELHGSLTEALNDLASVRSASDADRAAIKEVRTERDQLRVRVTSLEQVEGTLQAKVAGLTAERDEASARADSSKAEQARLEKAMAGVSGERDRAFEELSASKAALQGLTGERDDLDKKAGESRARVDELEAERDNLRQQFDSLTEENAAIQAQLVESDRLRVETAESQGNALSELAGRLAKAENERNRYERELRVAEDRLIEAMNAFDAANKVAADRVRDQLGDEPSAIAPLLDPSDTPSTEQADDSRSIPIDTPADKGTAGKGKRPIDVTSKFPAGLGQATGDVPVVVSGDVDSTAPNRIVPPSLLGDASQDPVRDRPANRWDIGPLGRGDQRDDEGQDATEAIPSLADGPAAPVPQLRSDATDSGPVLGHGDDSQAGRFVEDIDEISTELAQVIGGSNMESGDGGDDVDLDAISDLISQTITDFDPTAVPSQGPEGDPLADQGAKNLPPGDEDSSPAFEAAGKGRAAGPPPSVFVDSADSAPRVSGPLEASTGETPIAASDETKQGRRQIDIPVDLLDDEVEMARYVVSSPDVVLLVDGDSVAKMGWPSLPVAQQRDALVSYLTDLATTTGAAPDVVFDGRIAEEDALPSSRSVRIRLSTPPTEPTAALDELVDAYPEQWPIAIVTDDDDLAKSALERGTTVLNNGQLLDLFISQ